ncbi:Sorbitol dehydrogenase [Tolypocladium paradoxum]|uniref:Sorbitol dehydrogenase n=1 Tax=Tolypocladium paradoxum TaxID=94208 RepID=A0A2S4KLT0_9HYPO|nr:Sorbitol dehydrogenase [Tolypocladium paradoxum]
MSTFLQKLFSLQGRTAVVTGGTRGIGQAMALSLAEAGADIILIQVRDDKNLETKHQIEALGRRATVYTADLSNQEQVEGLTKRILVDGHDPSILVTCAGIQRRHPAHQFPMSDWDEVLQVNLKTVWTLCRDLGAYMLTRTPDANRCGYRGSIVNVASLVSFQGGITVPAYAAAKGGIAQLTKALSNEWASKGVNVNAIAPGYVATDMNEALINNPERANSILARIPAGRWGTPEDFMGATVFLSGAGSLYVSGELLTVDGGWMGRCTSSGLDSEEVMRVIDQQMTTGWGINPCNLSTTVMATQSIDASVLYGPEDIRAETRTLGAPSPDELQVSIKATGICGSDLHYYKHFRNGDILVREPMSLGHESAGVVEAVGSGVTGFKAGDRVALEVGLSCGGCKLCDAGRYNLCPRMKFRGSAKVFPHFQGTLQKRINHPASMCYKLPENVTLEEGALLEPLSVAIHAVRRAALKPGVNALILGSGAVGLLVAAMLRVEKASSITIADIEEQRVNFATSNGFADKGVVVPRGRAETRSVDEKLALAQDTSALLMGGTDQQFDVVFECTGAETCVQAAIYSAAPSGRVMIIGMGTPVQTLPLLAAALREVDIVGVFRYANTYQYGIHLLANKGELGLPDVLKLVTQRYSGLNNVPSAFAAAARPVDDQGQLVIKVLIET